MEEKKAFGFFRRPAVGLCGAMCAVFRLHVEPVNHVLQSGVSGEEVEEKRRKKRKRRNGVTR